jgi:hypothetical protein
VGYPTAWLIHHKLMQVMAERDERYLLAGKVQVDDAYLGGERTGGKVGRGSENKVAFVAAVSLNEADRPLRVRLTPVAGFTLKAVAAWAKDHLASGSAVFSDGLACFGAVTAAGCSHQPTVIAGRKPKEVPAFKWINTVFGNPQQMKLPFALWSRPAIKALVKAQFGLDMQDRLIGKYLIAPPHSTARLGITFMRLPWLHFEVELAKH